MNKKNNTTENNFQPVGNIDGVFHHFLTGWFSLEGEDKDCELVLKVDGRATLTETTKLPRPDVESHHGFGGKSGFSFNLESLEDTRVVEISIVHADSEFDFNGCKLNYCVGISQNYNIIRDIFFPEYYRCRYDLCDLSNDEAFQEFIKEGIFNDRDPNPWFSNAHYREYYPERVENDEVPLLCYLSTEYELTETPSALFDPSYYLGRYPDLKNAYGLLWHFAMYGKNEGRIGIKNKIPDSIQQEFDDISEIEPMVASAVGGLNHIVRYPNITKATYLSKLVLSNIDSDIKAVICVPFISRGGADLVSTFLFRAYQGAYGKDKVLMLVTDKASIEVPEWIDDGSQVVVLDEECTFLDEDEKLDALHVCLGRLAPEKIVNVNSNITWKLFERYGVQLSTVADLYAYLFCFDYDVARRKVGYITQYLPKTLRCLKAVYFDNRKIVNDIETLYGFTNKEMSKLHTVYIPAPDNIKPVSTIDVKSRNTILWAGRLSLQKRPDILISVAQALPNQQFDVYGQAGNSECSARIIKGEIPNLNYCGVYNSVDEVDFEKYIAFLNTSEWEGIPTIIIQLMAMGIPIVTTSVGGIPELVTDETGWLIDDVEDVEAYVVAINRLAVLTDLVSSKVEKGMLAIENNHQWHSYYKKLESLNAFTEHKSMERVVVQFKDRRKAA